MPRAQSAAAAPGARILFLAMLCATLLPSLVPAKKKTDAQGKRWSVRYVSGALNLPSRTRVRLTVGDDTISGESKHDGTFTIPTAAIAEIGYDQQSHSKGWAWLKGAGSAGGGGTYSGLAAAPLLVGAAIAAPFKTKEHYVRLLWQKGGEVEEAVFEVGKDDYLGLLADIQRATHKPWKDMPAERMRVDEELKKGREHSLRLELDRNTAVGDGEIKAGVYQMIVLEREADLAELFLFSGKDVNPKDAVAQIMVRTAPPAAGVTSARAVYRNEEGLTTISEIRLPGKTLLLAGLTIPHSEVPPARRFYAGEGWWAIVSRVEHEGQPALRFPVAHLKPGRLYRCRGFLVVTADEIAYEPGTDIDNRCDYFRAARGNLRASQATSKWSGATLKVIVHEKTYSFTALLERGTGEQRLPVLGKTREAGEEFGRFFVQAVTDFESAQRETQPPPAAPPQ
jgi:hypothetical protein